MPDYSRQGGQIIASQLAKVTMQANIQNVRVTIDRRHGTVDQTSSGKALVYHAEPLNLNIYANPNYSYLDVKPGSAQHLRQGRRRWGCDAYKAGGGERRKKIAEDSVNAFLLQLPNVTVADAKLKGLNRADLRQRPLGHVVAIGETARAAKSSASVQPFRISALELLSA